MPRIRAAGSNRARPSSKNKHPTPTRTPGSCSMELSSPHTRTDSSSSKKPGEGELHLCGDGRSEASPPTSRPTAPRCSSPLLSFSPSSRFRFRLHFGLIELHHLLPFWTVLRANFCFFGTKIKAAAGGRACFSERPSLLALINSELF
jgi:hypothetical protein